MWIHQEDLTNICTKYQSPKIYKANVSTKKGEADSFKTMETSINHSQEQNHMEEQNKETEDMNSPINQRYLTERCEPSIHNSRIHLKCKWNILQDTPQNKS